MSLDTMTIRLFDTVKDALGEFETNRDVILSTLVNAAKAVNDAAVLSADLDTVYRLMDTYQRILVGVIMLSSLSDTMNSASAYEQEEAVMVESLPQEDRRILLRVNKLIGKGYPGYGAWLARQQGKQEGKSSNG